MIAYTKIFASFSVDDLKKEKDFYQNIVGIPVEETPFGLVLQIAADQFAFIYPGRNHTPATYTIFNFRAENVENTSMTD